MYEVDRMYETATFLPVSPPFFFSQAASVQRSSIFKGIEEQAQLHWPRCMTYQELDHTTMWRHSRLTSMYGASTTTLDLLVARISTKTVVVVNIVGLNGT
jgi:hypothetical protein